MIIQAPAYIDPKSYVPSHVIYDETDPLIVSIIFEQGNGPVTWVFAANLLRDGGGEGDVVVEHTHQHVHVMLRSPQGTVIFSYIKATIQPLLNSIIDVDDIEISDEALAAWLAD